MTANSHQPKQPDSKRTDNLIWTRIFYGREVMDRILENISQKHELQRRFIWRYVLRAAMAGFIITLMYLFTYQVKTDLGFSFNPGLVKYLSAFSFSFALVFIYFSNSELLTSNFMYFTVGAYYRKIKIGKIARILGMCLFGNLIGAILFAALAGSSGLASPEVTSELIHTVHLKTTGSGAWTIFVKAIFANFLINISIIIAMQMGSDFIAKIFTLMGGVMIFSYMGFEHVVANSGLFALAIAVDPASVDLLHAGKNFLFSLLGNYVGGGLIIGLFYAFLNDDRKLQQDHTA